MGNHIKTSSIIMGKKAINKNGTIKVYEGVPKVLYASNGTHLNAQAMSNAELRAAGLFDVVLPEGYNSAIHDLSEIFFDSANIVYTYTKSDKTWDATLEEMKASKISNLKASAHSKLAQTDWYILRALNGGTAVPDAILAERQSILDAVITKENEINALLEKAEVVLYNINID